MYDGTLCTRGPWQALVTFQQMLVLADQEGCVDMTASAISRRTTIPIEIIELGIIELLKEDPESRTPTERGKRIIPLCDGRSWGWQIVNYKHYRQLKREEDRREYHRDYWYRRKKEQQDNSTALNSTQPAQPNQPIAEAEAYTEAIPIQEIKGVGGVFVPPSASPTKKGGEKKKGARLPKDWELPQSWGVWALNENRALTPGDIRKEANKFKNHWLAKAGKDAVKLDWYATWRNWITSDFVKPSGTPPPEESARWFLSATGITAKGATVNIAPLDGENFPSFKDRVFAHFKVTDEMVRNAQSDKGKA